MIGHKRVRALAPLPHSPLRSTRSSGYASSRSARRPPSYSLCLQVANAVFLFPVDPTAALSSFRGVKDDGAVLVGVIKEKQEAVRDYDAAVGRGKDAALVSSLGGGDVIVLKVGSLLPQSGITVTLSLVVPLDCPDRHTARFSLPTVIGARYVPKGIPSPFAADAACDPMG